LTPQLETPEEAMKIVEASRYPAQRGSTVGGGRRGHYPHVASRYWGLTDDDYSNRSDLWPQNPDGEILLIGIIESVAGVDNIERILDATDGYGAIWPGPGDLSADMGLMGQSRHPEVQEKLLHVLEVCKSRNVPCVGADYTVEGAIEKIRQGFQIVSTWPVPGGEAALRAAYREYHQS
jgi:4-hydroxy-2-oxoheptanedioate aldolase